MAADSEDPCPQETPAPPAAVPEREAQDEETPAPPAAVPEREAQDEETPAPPAAVPEREAQDEDAEAEAEADDIAAIADIPIFDKGTWNVDSLSYGLSGLLRCREEMLPIAKPEEVAHLKFLICPSFDDKPEPDAEGRDQRQSRGDRGGGAGDSKGKGKGKGRGDKGLGGKGRYVQDMGKTEASTATQRGQWWRNVACEGKELTDVIVREQFSLASKEIWKVPPGHYVQQGGYLEVFVNGQATGLQRMPVQPRGWATVDASAVGGPRYLEPVKTPRWKVIFKSGTPRGDIVVRSEKSLESEEVAVLLFGTYVEQSGPQEVLEDGIVRMPVLWPEGVGQEPASPSRPPKRRQGWVTCDATSQGGPMFFEPSPGELEPPKPSPPLPQQPREPPASTSGGTEAAGGAGSNGAGPSAVTTAGPRLEGGSWSANRTWKVVNLAGDKDLPVVSRAEPYAPGTGRVPPEDILVRWLANNDVVVQVGHSKKMRGYMVMPVRMAGEKPETEKDDQGEAEGWVTRRLVDKDRNHEQAWFDEVKGEGGEDGERPGRKQRSSRQPRASED